MIRLRSGPLVAWASAWLGAQVDLAAAAGGAIGADAPHQVGGLDQFGAEPVPLREALLAWQRAGATVRLVLPVPGDVRGLPGPSAFRSAALGAGEAVCAPGLSLVPQVIEHLPSSAPTTVLWQAFDTEAPPEDHLQISDAQYELRTAIRESASALSAADTAGRIDEVAEQLRDARRAGEELNLPPGFPPPAVALLAQAERLQAVLDLAAQDPTGGAIDRTGIAARAAGLHPLAAAVRRARVAGYNALTGASAS